MRRSEARTANRTAAAVATVAPAVGVVGLGVSLFLLSNYLSARFDQGAPVTHSVDQYLMVWLSIAAVGGVGLAWLVVGLAPARRTWQSARRPNRQTARASHISRSRARRRN